MQLHDDALIFKDLKIYTRQNEFLALTILFIGLSLASLVTHVQGKVNCFVFHLKIIFHF